MIMMFATSKKVCRFHWLGLQTSIPASIKKSADFRLLIESADFEDDEVCILQWKSLQTSLVRSANFSDEVCKL